MARASVGQSCEGKEQIGKAVEVNHYKGRNFNFFSQADNGSFGSPTDRPCKMQGCRARCSAWKNERLERLELQVALIDECFQFGDSMFGNYCFNEMLLHFFTIGCCEQRTDTEQIALDAEQYCGNTLVHVRCPDYPDHRVKFVDIAICGDARVVLVNTAAAEEPGVTGVTSTRVDLHPAESTRSTTVGRGVALYFAG